MTFAEWKAKHQDVIDEEIAKVSDLILRHLYNAFSDDIYRDGFNDGVETTEERFLGEREEEL